MTFKNGHSLYAVLILVAACGQRSDMHTGPVSVGTAQRAEGNAFAPEQNSDIEQKEVIANNSSIEIFERDAPAEEIEDRPTEPDSIASSTPDQGNAPGLTAGASEEQPESPAPQPTQSEEEELPSTAMPPSIVSGSYMICRSSAEFTTVVCSLKTQNGSPVSLPRNAILFWSILADNSLLEVPTTAKRVDTNEEGTLFFVNVKSMPSGKVILRDASQQVLSAEISSDRLSNPSGLLQSVPVTSSAPYGRSIQGVTRPQSYGSGAADPGCTMGANTQRMRTHTTTIDVGNSSTRVGFLYTGLCGLSGSKVKVTVTGPGLKPRVIMLTPSNGMQVILADVALSPGVTTIRLDASDNKRPDGTLEFFTMEGFRTTTPGGGYSASIDYSMSP